MVDTYQKGQKTLGKEKLLIKSNFFFSHSVLKRLVYYIHAKNQGLFRKGLMHCKNSDSLKWTTFSYKLCVYDTMTLFLKVYKTLYAKEKLLVTSIFSLSYVFKMLFLRVVKTNHCVIKVNSFPNKPWFYVSALQVY